VSQWVELAEISTAGSNTADLLTAFRGSNGAFLFGVTSRVLEGMLRDVGLSDHSDIATSVIERRDALVSAQSKQPVVESIAVIRSRESDRTRALSFATRQWYRRNGTLATLVIIASASRIESMAILRLQLSGRRLIDFPMAHKYFNFLQYAGMYHYLVEDVPHISLSIALLAMSQEEECELASSVPFSAHTTAYLSIATSMFSILYGVVRKGGQWITREAERRSWRSSVSTSWGSVMSAGQTENAMRASFLRSVSVQDAQSDRAQPGGAE